MVVDEKNKDEETEGKGVEICRKMKPIESLDGGASAES